MKERIVPKRYVTIEKGIRKDLLNNTYLAHKQIKGQQYSASFEKLTGARMWRMTYVPPEEKAIQLKMTVGELRENYINDYLVNLATSTRLVRVDRLKILDEIQHLLVEDLTPNQIQQFFQSQMNVAKSSQSRRMSFNEEIKDLRALLNWYKETYNYKYVVPVISKRLKASCTISKEKRVKQKLTPEEFLAFFNSLDPFYQDVALIQSRIAGRICETTGLQFKAIDLKNRILTVKYIVVYGRRKEFIELKPYPKESDVRHCYITDDMMEVLTRRLELKHPNSDYVFHFEGEPIKYRSVQHAYDHALKKIGLYGKTSGTHMVRHFTATLTRFVCGNLDAVQSVTGHKSMKLVEHYGKLASSLQGDSISKVESFLKQKAQEAQETCATPVQIQSSTSEIHGDHSKL